MHEEQNNAPVKTVQSNRQEANFPNLEEKENLKQFYLTQSRRLCPTVSVDRSELQRLGALHHKIKHFIKALTNLDRSWENGMPEILYKTHLAQSVKRFLKNGRNGRTS